VSEGLCVVYQNTYTHDFWSWGYNSSGSEWFGLGNRVEVEYNTYI